MGRIPRVPLCDGLCLLPVLHLLDSVLTSQGLMSHTVLRPTRLDSASSRGLSYTNPSPPTPIPLPLQSTLGSIMFFRGLDSDVPGGWTDNPTN